MESFMESFFMPVTSNTSIPTKNRMNIGNKSNLNMDVLQKAIEEARKLSGGYLMNYQQKMLQEMIYGKTIDCGFYPEDISNVEFYPPAVKMTFRDGTVTTAVPQEGDEYDPKTGMMVCIMKYIWSEQNYNTALNKWINEAEKKAKEKDAREKALADEKAKRERKIKKAIARKERKKQEAIEIQKEAYIRAMKEINDGATE